MFQRIRWLVISLALLSLPLIAAVSVSRAEPALQATTTPSPEATTSSGTGTPTSTQEEQAQQGEMVYEDHCARCHDPGGIGPRLTASVLAAYSTAQGLFNYVQATMPQDAPGTLSDQQYWDVIAYLLATENMLPAEGTVAPDTAEEISLTRPAETTPTPSNSTPTMTGTPSPANENENSNNPVNNSTAEELWQELEQAQYEGNWQTIPGKGAFYRGQPPHGALLSTYLNPAAIEALQTQPGQMPDGAIILKENYSSDRELQSVTVMQKRAGYNPEYGDWFWARYRPDGTVQAGGQVESCISCHGAVRSNDYVFSFPIAPIQVNPSSGQDSTSASEEEMSSEETSRISLGEQLFEANCAACHQADGQGTPDAYPALVDNEFVTADDPSQVIDIVLTGRAAMPSFQDEFSNQEVAAVVSYIRNGWSNNASMVTAEQVREVQEAISSQREAADNDQQN